MNARMFGFDTPIGGDGDYRRQPRVPVTLTARLRNRSAVKFDIRIIDMSVTGFRAEAHYSLDPGDIVWITMPGLQGLEATVAWRKKQLVGCRFERPLYPAVLDHIIKGGFSG